MQQCFSAIEASSQMSNVHILTNYSVIHASTLPLEETPGTIWSPVGLYVMLLDVVKQQHLSNTGICASKYDPGSGKCSPGSGKCSPGSGKSRFWTAIL